MRRGLGRATRGGAPPRGSEAALAAVPDILKVSLACPNKHYLLVNLAPFDLDNANQVFLPTDEPHGQIECTVGRG